MTTLFIMQFSNTRYLLNWYNLLWYLFK